MRHLEIQMILWYQKKFLKNVLDFVSLMYGEVYQKKDQYNSIHWQYVLLIHWSIQKILLFLKYITKIELVKIGL